MNFISKAGLILSKTFSVLLEKNQRFLWCITLIDLWIANHSKVNLIIMDNLHFILLNKYINFVYISTELPPPISPPIPSPFSPPPSTPPLFLFRKGQATHGYQESMAYQFGRTMLLPCVKAGQGNPEWEIGSWKPTKILRYFLHCPLVYRAIQLSHICWEPKFVPCRLPSC